MRVGIAGLQHESNTFLPGATTLSDFEVHGLLEGDAIVQRYRGAHHEVSGFIAELEAPGIDIVPIFFTLAVPSGVIDGAAAEALTRRLLAATEVAGALDGLLVAAHGAAVSEPHPDFDGHWLTRLRACVGDALPIICTLDAHANVSQAMIDACDATIVYRTNPHTDQRERGREAAALMVRTVNGEVRPVQAAMFPPLAINIERQLTTDPQCRRLEDRAEALRRRSGVLSANVVLGFPYSDVLEMGSSVVVVTDGNTAEASQAAAELAGVIWRDRDAFVGRLISVDEAIGRSARGAGTTVLLDMGDNVGGGSPGDGTILAHALLERGITRALVCLYDPSAAAQARAAGVGAVLQLSMGGHTDALHGPPLEMWVRVRSLHSGAFTEAAVRHGGAPRYDMGPTAVVESDVGLTIVLNSRRVPPFSLGQLTHCGLDPRDFRVTVAKGVHGPVAAYAEVCENMIRVNTPGITTADMTSLEFRRRRRPLFPFEQAKINISHFQIRA